MWDSNPRRPAHQSRSITNWTMRASADLHIRPIHDPPPLQPNPAPLNPRTNRKRTRETFLTSWNANDVFKSKHFVTRGNNDYVVQRPTMPITPMNRAQATM